MIKFNFDINKSKISFFLDVLVYLSIFSIISRSSIIKFFNYIAGNYFFFYSLKKKLFFKFLIKYLYWILGLLLFFSINIYYSNLPQESMQRFFSIVRFIFLAICLIYLLKNFDNFKKTYQNVSHSF